VDVRLERGADDIGSSVCIPPGIIGEDCIEYLPESRALHLKGVCDLGDDPIVLNL
jgi:hypothetical protein